MDNLLAGGGAIFLLLLKAGYSIGVIVAVWALATSYETGDNLWLWIPFILLFPYIGVPVYIVHRIRQRNQDMLWEKRKMEAHSKGGGRVSRRVKSEKELTDNYFKGKGMR